MAILNIRDENRILEEPDEIRKFLAQYGIWYRRFDGSDTLSEDASSEDILAAYNAPIQELMAEGGYVTADVVNVRPDTPGLDAMLAKFSAEHWHTENEVRFIVHGRGLFHIHPQAGPVFSIEVAKGDMINVPKGTLHWFDLCGERSIRAIRLFQDPAGWTPHYTDSHVESNYQPLCFGPTYIPAVGR
jgi:1,2-dihydroxy-3-keto-5-methylthiopentene dioxygenase